MANLKSSKKDIRRTKRRTTRNQAGRSRHQTALRAVKIARSKEVAEAAFLVASSLLDRAAQTKLVHWRKAARQKSRLAEFIRKKFPATK